MPWYVVYCVFFVRVGLGNLRTTGSGLALALVLAPGIQAAAPHQAPTPPSASPPLKVRWAGDRCCVCDSEVDFDFDQLVSCDCCRLTVHQSCYGIMDLPDVDDM